MFDPLNYKGISKEESEKLGDALLALADNNPTPLDALIARINAMLDWPINWNSYLADRISPVAVQNAVAWVTEVYERDASLLDGVNITSDAQGGVVLEWFGKAIEKHLTIYIDANIEYIQDWASDSTNDMDQGDVTSIEHFIQLKEALTQ